MSIILIGFMGAGKTLVASKLSPDFADTDQILSKQWHMPTSQYFDLHGEYAFRQQEEAVLSNLIAADDYSVLATGGGIVESPLNRKLLEKAEDVVYLKAKFATVISRLAADKKNPRSLFENLSQEAFQTLYERRISWYESLSNLTIEVDKQRPEEIVQKILEVYPLK